MQRLSVKVNLKPEEQVAFDIVAGVIANICTNDEELIQALFLNAEEIKHSDMFDYINDSPIPFIKDVYNILKILRRNS